MSNNIKNRQSAEILQAVYRNSQMAYEASSDVLKHCKNNMLYREINREKERYKNVAEQAKNELIKRNETAEEVAPFGKLMSKMGIAMKTASNQSGHNIAKIMVQGTTMGIIDMQHAVNRSHNADPRIKESAERLLQREQEYCESLKKYL
ncbi:MAG: hypothetical protein J6C38_05345 [Oscillospiraceae bacterium]|nr:hypothetical protein [Oscillospiraceae bacterium]